MTLCVLKTTVEHEQSHEKSSHFFRKSIKIATKWYTTLCHLVHSVVRNRNMVFIFNGVNT